MCLLEATINRIRYSLALYKIVLEKSAGSSMSKLILSKCAICGSKKSKFIKNQEAKGFE